MYNFFFVCCLLLNVCNAAAITIRYCTRQERERTQGSMGDFGEGGLMWSEYAQWPNPGSGFRGVDLVFDSL